MTEEEKLRSAPGCGSFIMLGLIGIVLLSLVGIIFPLDILPYPRSVLIGILIAAAVALGIFILIRRGDKREGQQAKDDHADQILRQTHHTLGHGDDEATRLAQEYDKGAH